MAVADILSALFGVRPKNLGQRVSAPGPLRDPFIASLPSSVSKEQKDPTNLVPDLTGKAAPRRKRSSSSVLGY